MKAKALFAVPVCVLAFAASSEAGGCGRWGYRGGWGGCYGGWGGGWWGPSISIGFVARPDPVYYYPAVYRVPAYAPVVVRTSGSTSALVRATQRRLSQLGYYRSSVDGEFGPITSRALATYQSDYGLPVTGRLDGRTRDSLGV